MSIVRTDVVTQVADAVRQWIVNGEIAPGARINETHVAQKLKVSRTPVREALARLVGEGALISIPNLGFFVAEVSEAELDETYCLRPILDTAALELAGLPSAEAILELKNLNRQLADAQNARDTVLLDERWHMRLLAHCPNTVLMGFIHKLIDQTRRYELLLFEDSRDRAATAAQHDEIIEALLQQDLAGACAALRANLTLGEKPIRTRIKKMAKPKAQA